MERKSKGAPNPAPQLEACYRGVIAAVLDRGWLKKRALFIGGKSMGGRMASHLAADPAQLAAPLAGLVFLGYPLHPPGKPQQLRSAHLPSIVAPMLFVQGARDTFGTPADLAPVLGEAAGPVDRDRHRTGRSLLQGHQQQGQAGRRSSIDISRRRLVTLVDSANTYGGA